MAQPILELRNLTIVFPTRRGEVRAVDAVNLALYPGQILGLVGESGCGKSTVLLSILGLIARPGRITGEVLLDGRDLTKLSNRELRKLRGKEIAMIFQDPLSTLNPAFPVGEQIRESLRLHNMVPGPWLWPFDSGRRWQEKQRVLQVMEEVGIPAPEARYRAYPHQFSGGMQQRALIAIGLACNPRILLADEPTTALDVTIQAQIIALMKRINQEHGAAIILVTHDLGLAAEFCDHIAVMYAGRIVEIGGVDQVIENPQHPYTQGLLRCIPNLKERRPLQPIPGSVPDLAELPPGCAFAPRCPEFRSVCAEGFFRLQPVIEDGHKKAHRSGEVHMARCLRLTGYRMPEDD
ncbi:MAG: ABC transporter ATP-binding protein [Caldilinea sp.]|nr:ABC transporter ATP-binding protein [Caldilinea sp.]MDW8440409.1 ABC transporter ATP-binding protein [Caldilineaceae bacterium]